MNDGLAVYKQFVEFEAASKSLLATQDVELLLGKGLLTTRYNNRKSSQNSNAKNSRLSATKSRKWPAEPNPFKVTWSTSLIKCKTGLTPN